MPKSSYGERESHSHYYTACYALVAHAGQGADCSMGHLEPFFFGLRYRGRLRTVAAFCVT